MAVEENKHHPLTPETAAYVVVFVVLQAIAGVNGAGFSLRLIHRDSVHSVLYPGKLSTLERYSRLLGYSSSYHQSSPEALQPIVRLSGSIHYVELRIGRQQRQQNLVMDSGSSLIWFQCAPCDPCFPQSIPMYVMGESDSFRYIACDDPLCLRNSQHSCDSENHCVYRVMYMSGSPAQGVIGREAFFGESTLGGQEVIPDLGFGCTNSCTNMFGVSTAMSGILGLGAGPQSLIMQIGPSVGYRFSHCLLPLNSDGLSYLRFGDDIRFLGQVGSTPLVLDARFPSYYFVELRGISIDGLWLPIPQYLFKQQADGGGGVIVDSGSWCTALIQPAYDILHREIRNHFAGYQVVTGTAPITRSLLCFGVATGERYPTFPTVTLHFQGSDMSVPPSNLFITFDRLGHGTFCMGIVPMPHTSFVGALQMVNKRIVYDLDRRLLSFAFENCELTG